MESEFQKTLRKEKAIAVSSPWILALLMIVFMILGVVLMVVGHAAATAHVLAGGGVCIAVAAMALVAHARSVQAKLNLEIVKAISELRTQLGKES
jgi:hypothetical protein